MPLYIKKCEHVTLRYTDWLSDSNEEWWYRHEYHFEDHVDDFDSFEDSIQERDDLDVCDDYDFYEIPFDDIEEQIDLEKYKK